MVNADKPGRWKDDIRASVELYNRWFLRFAPSAFRDERAAATTGVLTAFTQTADLADLTEPAVRTDPRVFAALRMCCAPPIARDRLAGLAGVNNGTVKALEAGRLPRGATLAVAKLVAVVEPLVDRWLFVAGREPAGERGGAVARRVRRGRPPVRRPVGPDYPQRPGDAAA